MPNAHLAAALKEQAEKRKATKKTSAVKSATKPSADTVSSANRTVESE